MNMNADHWVLCDGPSGPYAQGPYTAEGARSAKRRSDSSVCHEPHAIIRAGRGTVTALLERRGNWGGVR
jgi:hypothetical protein